MNGKRKGRLSTRVLLLVLLLLLLLPMALHAQFDPFELDDETEAPTVEPYHDNSVTLGIGVADGATFASGKYSGITDDGLVPQIDFRLQHLPDWDDDDTSFWRIEGWRIGQENRRLELGLGQQGTQRFSVTFQGIPNYRYDDGVTPFNGVGDAFLGLPPNWQAGANTAQMPLLAASLEPHNIGHERLRLDVGYQRVLDPNWSFNVDYRRETKEGTRIVGGLIGNTGGNRRAALLPAPVDYVTDIVDASVHYIAATYQAGLGVHASTFENMQSSITWQNPFGPVAGWAPGTAFPDGLGRTALEPTNRFYQARLFGGYNVSSTTRVSGTVAAGRMTQDERLLPYTVNPLIEAPIGLPRDSLDGRIDTMLADLRVSARPLPQLNVTARYRYDDRDNRTPRELWLVVRGDSLAQVGMESGRINLPYSFTEHRVNVDARYRLAARTRLIGSYTRTRKDRDFQEVARIDEDVFRIGLQFEPATMLALGLDYLRSERDGSDYDGTIPFIASHVPGTVDPTDPLDFENHPLLRKYYLADRTRDEIRGRADLYPAPAVSVGLEARYSTDDYADGFFGLRESRVQTYSLDAAWSPSDELTLATFYTHERFDSEQAGRNFRGGANLAPDIVNPARDWLVDNDDRIDTAGVTVEWAIGRALGGSISGLDVGADFVFSRARSRIDVTAGPALQTTPLPDLYTRVLAYGIHGSYRLNDATTLRLRLEHERYHARDFTLDDVPPAGVDAAGRVLGLGVASPRYRATWVVLVFERGLTPARR